MTGNSASAGSRSFRPTVSRDAQRSAAFFLDVDKIVALESQLGRQLYARGRGAGRFYKRGQ